MFRVISKSLSLLFCVFALAMSQSPSIWVSPDSIPLYLEQYERAIDSFKITNRGSDTLHYTFSTRFDQAATGGHSTYLSGAPNQIADSLVRGTILQASEDLYVSEFGYGFEASSPVHVEFFVFEGDSETGRYTKAFSSTKQFNSLSTDNWISSGAINVEIDSGKYYIVGVSWDNPMSFAESTGPCCGNDGPSMVYKGSFTQTHSYPSDTEYSISSFQNNGVTYDMSLMEYFPLFIRILSDSSGYLLPADSTVVKFEVRTGSHYGGNSMYPPMESSINVLSENSRDSIAHVTITLPLITGVLPSSVAVIPSQFALNQNYPNPFNPLTTIAFRLPKQSFITLEVFNLLGQRVTTLLSDERPAGDYSVQWDASGQPSGVYYYRLRTDSFSNTKKLLLVR